MAPMNRDGNLRRIWSAGAILVLWATCGEGQISLHGETPDEATLFGVTCARGAELVDACTVDRRTYVGWQVFHRTCAVCHAADAVGSSFAPNLLPRIRRMNGREFAAAMDEGYAGEAEMPPGAATRKFVPTTSSCGLTCPRAPPANCRRANRAPRPCLRPCERADTAL